MMADAVAEAANDSAALSQTVRVQLRLRELILAGELPPGERIAELTLVERLGASRTPIRMALVRLQEEGLLDALPHGGFAVKDFSEADIHDAIELREGVASIFREDESILEAQQQAIDERPGYSFYNLNIDAGSMWARRLIEQQLRAEQQGTRVIPLRAA
jgi:DNA-binding GntR family transcriptional regulator